MSGDKNVMQLPEYKKVLSEQTSEYNQTVHSDFSVRYSVCIAGNTEIKRNIETFCVELCVCIDISPVLWYTVTG